MSDAAEEFADQPDVPIWNGLRWVNRRAAAIVGPDAYGKTTDDGMATIRLMTSGLATPVDPEDAWQFTVLMASNVDLHARMALANRIVPLSVVQEQIIHCTRGVMFNVLLAGIHAGEQGR